jgi:hypothetical protein
MPASPRPPCGRCRNTRCGRCPGCPAPGPAPLPAPGCAPAASLLRPAGGPAAARHSWSAISSQSRRCSRGLWTARNPHARLLGQRLDQRLAATGTLVISAGRHRHTRCSAGAMKASSTWTSTGVSGRRRRPPGLHQSPAGHAASSTWAGKVRPVAQMPAATHHGQVHTGLAALHLDGQDVHVLVGPVSTDCWCSTRDSAVIWLRSSAACSNSSRSAWAIMRAPARPARPGFRRAGRPRRLATSRA